MDCHSGVLGMLLPVGRSPLPNLHVADLSEKNGPR